MPRHKPREAVLVTSVADQFKPFRDRHVKTTGVPCPSCGAEAGEVCQTSTGGRSVPHRERRRMALRVQRGEDVA